MAGKSVKGMVGKLHALVSFGHRPAFVVELVFRYYAFWGERSCEKCQYLLHGACTIGKTIGPQIKRMQC